MKKIPVDEALLQKIINYLASRPYSDVYLLIAEMQQAASQTVVAEETAAKE